MHSIIYLILLNALSDARALPVGDTINPATRLISSTIGAPTPSTYSLPGCNESPSTISSTGNPAIYSARSPSPTWTTTGWTTGSANSTHILPTYTSSSFVSSSAITGVPAPGLLTSPIEPPDTCESTTGRGITVIPVPTTTSTPGSTTISTLSSTSTSFYPTAKPTARSCRPSWSTSGHTGSFRAAVIFIDFPDFEANTNIKELWDPIATYPAHLFRTMSYGKLNLELVPNLNKFYRMPVASSSYNYARGLTTEMHVKYIKDALQAVGKDANYTNVNTLFIIPPKGASAISFSTSTRERITAPDGSVIPSSITYGQDLFSTWGPKTVNHETGHAMGLPDLYPFDGSSIQKWVGGFDMMGVIGGQSPDYTAWHKWQLNWLEESQIDCVLEPGFSQHRISPIEVRDETRDSPKAIAIPVNGTQYVMAEVRSQLGVNTGACGTGVLLYTADSAVKTGDGPIRVIDTKPNSNGCDAAHGGELNDAPLKVGEEYDAGQGVIIRVKSQEWNDYIVEVERKAQAGAASRYSRHTRFADGVY